MIVLVINCGSSSVKYKVIESNTSSVYCSGIVERIGAVTSIFRHESSFGKSIKETLVVDDHSKAMKVIMDYITQHIGGFLPQNSAIEAVGHRVVHGGESFKESVLIDQDVIEAIETAFDLAPLHNPPNLKGIKAAQEHLPNVPHVAVFDTAFHHSLPPEAYLYAIPNRLYRRYKIRKYGFHGISHYYVSRKYHELFDPEFNSKRIITIHLGNGSSVCAIKDGKSIETSMGFTPLSGLIMGTRSGDIDPSIMFYLIEKEELSISNVHALLNQHSGLLGLSGYSSDMRDLLQEAEKGDVRCQQAIDSYCYRIKQYVGSYIATMNGVDAILFTAGIGENSAVIRQKALAGLDELGISIDENLNKAHSTHSARKISSTSSKVSVYTIPTDEELVIAQDAAKIALALKQSPWV
jgi:acetate kinase